jgi:hypothetical protein
MRAVGCRVRQPLLPLLAMPPPPDACKVGGEREGGGIKYCETDPKLSNRTLVETK